jgi:hypothetical protein
LVITTLLVLQTGQLNRHSAPPSSRGQHVEIHSHSDGTVRAAIFAGVRPSGT